MFNKDLEELIKKGMDMIDNALSNPDSFNDNTLVATKRASALSTRLKVMSIELKHSGDKQGAEKVRAISDGLENLVGVLKYQIRTHLNSQGQ